MFQGIYAGYRSYEINKLQPLFPFGYGLSYTTFSCSDLYVTRSSSKDTFYVSFTVKNTGKVLGREVAQVYIAPPCRDLSKVSKGLP